MASIVDPAARGPPAAKPATSFLTKAKPFIVGGLSGCVATCCIQPVDMVKVRLQLAGEGGAHGSKSPIHVFKTVLKDEGARALYKGLDAGIIRQLTYSTARLGLFRVFSDKLKEMSQKADPTSPPPPLPLWKKAAAGLAAGGIAAAFGNPADLALVRMQADATLPPESRRNYTGVLNALSRIVKEEGVLGLWRGSFPTVLRAMSLNMGMLATNDQCKEMLAPKLGHGWTTTLTASAISGFFAVTFSLPFDFLKTRLQKMRPDPVTGELPYKGVLDAIVKITKKEGITAFYTGYPTYYVRIAPHAMITLICMDLFNKALTPYM